MTVLFSRSRFQLTGLAMGVYQAWQSSRDDLVALEDGGRAVTGSRGSSVSAAIG